MAKLPGKGCALQEEVAMTFTAIAQLVSFGRSGTEQQTADTTTLDQANAGRAHDPTGYTEFGSYDFEGFLDPKNATHASLQTKLGTPAKFNAKAVFTDGSEEAFSVSGVSLDNQVTLDDMIRVTGSLKIDGDVAFTAGT